MDKEAGAISPQKLYGVPVGLMFYEGAPRLLECPASILPVRPNDDPRVVVEAYPGLAARRWSGGESYKNDTRAKQTAAQRAVRERIVEALTSVRCRDAYGLTLRIDADQARRLVEDPGADLLDAQICAVQAAWAWSRRASGYGIRPDADRLEGAIADPGLLETEGYARNPARSRSTPSSKVSIERQNAKRR